MTEIAVGVVAIVILLALVGPGRSSELRGRVLIYLVAWGGISIRLGVKLDLASVAAILILIFDRTAIRDLRATKLAKELDAPLFVVATGAGLLTLIFHPDVSAALTSEGQTNSWGTFQVAYRFPVQCLRWFLVLLVPATIVALGRRIGAQQLIRHVVDAAVASVLFGCVQVAMQLFGGPWPSASRWGELFDGNFGLRENLLTVNLGGLEIPRLFGLAGEPKHTAATILVALVGLSYLRVNGHALRYWIQRTRLILLVGLLLTFSTGSYLLALLIVPLTELSGKHEIYRRRSRAPLRLFGLATVLVVVVLSGVGSALFEARVAGRLDGFLDINTSSEPKDAAAIAVIIDNPWQIAGFGPGLADGLTAEKFPSPLRYIVDGGPPTPSYTVTRLAVESGLFGLTIYAAFVFATLKESSGRHRRLVVAMGALTLTTPFLVFPFSISTLALFRLHNKQRLERIADLKRLKPTTSAGSVLLGQQSSRLHHDAK